MTRRPPRSTRTDTLVPYTTLFRSKSFNVPAQSAATGIPALAEQADIQILVSEEAVRGKTIRAIKGSMTVDQAVRRPAADACLRIVSFDGRPYTLASSPSSYSVTPFTLPSHYCYLSSLILFPSLSLLSSFPFFLFSLPSFFLI